MMSNLLHATNMYLEKRRVLDGQIYNQDEFSRN